MLAMGATAVVLLLLGLLWFGLRQHEQNGVGAVAVPFKKAPNFTLTLFDGTKFTLANEIGRGKPVVVNFWASWCGPCNDEASVLQTAAQQNASRATFLGVDVEDVDSDALSFLHRYGVTYPNGSGNAGPISIQYGLRGVPETYFIAANGTVVRKWAGPLDKPTLDRYLTEAERASAPVGG